MKLIGMKKNRSLKVNATLNVIKQICSILFPMITFPFASRVLGKFSYGKINFGQSIISYITLIAGLGISNYAIREGAKIRNDKDRLSKFCNEVFSINVISTVISYIVLFFLIFFWKRLDGYATLLLIQSMTVLFTTIGTDWINSIYEDYLYITIRYIVCQSIAMVLMLTLVRSSDDYLIYAFSSVCSTVLANIMNIGYIRKTYQINVHFSLCFNARRHLKPILILFGTQIASLIYINSDVTILGVLKDENEVGLYSVSAKIYSLVKHLLNAMLIVAIPRVSHEIATKDQSVVNEHLSEIIGDLLVLVCPACIGLFMLARNIVLLFSGSAFADAASSLQILSLGLIFATVACFYINVVMIPYRMETKVLIATITSALENIVLNFVLIPTWGQNAAAFTTFLSEFIMMTMGIIYTRNVIKLEVRRPLLIGILNGVWTLLVCFAIQRFDLGNLLTILFSMVLSVVGCALILLIGYREKFNSLAGGLLAKFKKK